MTRKELKQIDKKVRAANRKFKARHTRHYAALLSATRPAWNKR